MIISKLIFLFSKEALENLFIEIYIRWYFHSLVCHFVHTFFENYERQWVTIIVPKLKVYKVLKRAMCTGYCRMCVVYDSSLCPFKLIWIHRKLKCLHCCKMFHKPDLNHKIASNLVIILLGQKIGKGKFLSFVSSP